MENEINCIMLNSVISVFIGHNIFSSVWSIVMILANVVTSTVLSTWIPAKFDHFLPSV